MKVIGIINFVFGIIIILITWFELSNYVVISFCALVMGFAKGYFNFARLIHIIALVLDSLIAIKMLFIGLAMLRENTEDYEKKGKSAIWLGSDTFLIGLISWIVVLFHYSGDDDFIITFIVSFIMYCIPMSLAIWIIVCGVKLLKNSGKDERTIIFNGSDYYG